MRPASALPLLRASHPVPTAAVTALTGLLAVAAGHSLRTGTVVTAAVAAGQLTIGWSNDLIDAARDRQVGRADKPVARGEVTEGGVRVALAVAGVLCVALSLACGPASATVHLVLGVGSGWAYNLGLKRTAWSAAPYAVAFGALPAVVTLALPEPQLPRPGWWWSVPFSGWARTSSTPFPTWPTTPRPVCTACPIVSDRGRCGGWRRWCSRPRLR